MGCDFFHSALYSGETKKDQNQWITTLDAVDWRNRKEKSEKENDEIDSYKWQVTNDSQEMKQTAKKGQLFVIITEKNVL